MQQHSTAAGSPARNSRKQAGKGKGFWASLGAVDAVQLRRLLPERKSQPRSRPALRAPSGSPRPLKICYLFTTFPLLSETPYQRELRALACHAAELEIHSIWGGEAAFEGKPVQRFAKWRAVSLLWLLPYWSIRRPEVFSGLFKRLAARPMPSLLNAGEMVLGLAFALCQVRHFQRSDQRPDLIHAAWATLPATAAKALSELTGIPYSMGAHAYDVFRHGGDWDLAGKLQGAALVVTSTRSTHRQLLASGAEPEKTVVIRRGFDVMPLLGPARRGREPIRLLSVGRLLEKKGYGEQLEIYAALRAAGVPFEARIVGAGPLARRLRKQASALGLCEQVTFLGALPHEAVRAQYAWADVLLFTGKVARSGDRDGLPNVIPEAMAFGVPVVASAVAGVPEAISHGHSGVLITKPGPGPWLKALRRLQHDDDHYEALRLSARAWVEENYDARANVGRLFDLFSRAVVGPPSTLERSLAKEPLCLSDALPLKPPSLPSRPAQQDEFFRADN